MANGMYSRFARDLSAPLFDSVYRDLYRLAESQQRDLWRAAKGRRRHYRIGEAQEMLDSFCSGNASLGCALDFIGSRRFD